MNLLGSAELHGCPRCSQMLMGAATDTREATCGFDFSGSGGVRGDGVLCPLNVTLFSGAHCRTAHASRA